MRKVSKATSHPAVGVYARAGRYFRVWRNVWYPLTRVSDGRASMLEALVKFEREHIAANKKPPTSKHGTVVNLCEDWLAAKPALAERTLRDYGFRVKADHFDKYWSRVKYKRCETMDVNKYLASRRLAGSGSSANRDIGLIGGAYKWANVEGLCDIRPTLGAVRNREKGHGAEPPEWSAVDNLIGELMAVPDRFAPLAILIVAAWSTGARLSALITMDLASLVREPNEAAVSDIVAVRWTEPKTGRRIELKCAGSDLAVWLDMSTKQTRAEGVTALFVRRDGHPWTESSVVQAMVRAGSPFTFRTLRAGAATAAYAADRTNLLGHAAALARRYVRHTIGAPTPQS